MVKESADWSSIISDISSMGLGRVISLAGWVEGDEDMGS